MLYLECCVTMERCFLPVRGEDISGLADRLRMADEYDEEQC